MEYVFDRIPKELYDVVQRLEEHSIETPLSLINTVAVYKEKIK
jgi:hypothetical protein